MHDRELVDTARAAAAGDRDAAEQVLAAIQDDVYRLALRMLGHPADAEDATQETLVIVLTHLATFRGERAPSAPGCGASRRTTCCASGRGGVRRS